MESRWKRDRPPSLQKFMATFPDDDSCAAYLARKRWPSGFVCPVCGSCTGWKLESKAWTWECKDCGRQTSVTAGTIMHKTRLPLRTWFLAAHFVTTHSNGISALQLQAKLGISSYGSAWLLLHKLRKAMVDPDRTALAGIVEIDESTIPFRTKDEPAEGGQGRSPIGKMVIAGAVELREGRFPTRIRLEPIRNFARETLHSFVLASTCTGSEIWTDGNLGYANVPGRTHLPRTVRGKKAHELMPWIHRVFSNLKRFAMGVYHGFRRKYLSAYLNEFVFRWNRRRHYKVAFDSLLRIGIGLGPVSLRALTGS